MVGDIIVGNYVWVGGGVSLKDFFGLLFGYGI